MSDKPQGPGWWLASDGTWHPPELHPSVHEPTRAMIPPATGPEAIVPAPAAEAPGPGRESTVTLPPPAPATPRAVPSMPGTAKRPAWSGESDRRAEAGPMYPDLFKQAVSGSRLADAITVNFTDGERRPILAPGPGLHLVLNGVHAGQPVELLRGDEIELQGGVAPLRVRVS